MTPATINSEWLRQPRPENGLILITPQDALILADALEMADDTARSDIELYAPLVVSMNPPFYDTRASEPIFREYVEKAVRYLGERGLIEHGPEPHLVRFPDTRVCV